MKARHPFGISQWACKNRCLEASCYMMTGMQKIFRATVGEKQGYYLLILETPYTTLIIMKEQLYVEKYQETCWDDDKSGDEYWFLWSTPDHQWISWQSSWLCRTVFCSNEWFANARTSCMVNCGQHRQFFRRCCRFVWAATIIINIHYLLDLTPALFLPDSITGNLVEAPVANSTTGGAQAALLLWVATNYRVGI